MVKLADTLVSGTSARKGLGVQVPLWAGRKGKAASAAFFLYGRGGLEPLSKPYIQAKEIAKGNFVVFAQHYGPPGQERQGRIRGLFFIRQRGT